MNDLTKNILVFVVIIVVLLTVVQGLSGVSGTQPQSRDYSEFLNQVRGLNKMADENNPAGTYYYFTRMTGVCFSCHEHVRGSE